MCWQLRIRKNYELPLRAGRKGKRGIMTQNEAYIRAEREIKYNSRHSRSFELNLNSEWGANASEKLAKLPDSIEEIYWLLSINLACNQLTELPESIGRVHQLQQLNLFANRLVVLPESIGKLVNLYRLNLSANQLIRLPKSIGGLNSLQHLDLSCNKLTTLPKSLGKLATLYRLNLSENQLSWLQESTGDLTSLHYLDLSRNQLITLPDSISNLARLHHLNFYKNQLNTLPESIGELGSLQYLDLSCNQLITLPGSIGNLARLHRLNLSNNQLNILPESIGQLIHLRLLHISNNQLVDLPSSLAQLDRLERFELKGNPLNPELDAAYTQGLTAVKAYLRAKADSITLNEAKLILIGEGEVGKTCLLDALLNNPWQEHDTTHGIEIKSVQITEQASDKKITLNAWDFGGQRVYRPTHQLFFSAPAVYLVIWKPREGWKQNFVNEWIQLIKHREPDAKVLVVATHGGPKQRQPDIDRQELRDLFGKETVLGFISVESKPDANGKRRGIKELKRAIAEVAVVLPEMGRNVPKSFQEVRQDLKAIGKPFLPLDQVLTVCSDCKMDDEVARLFLTISHRLGHLIHYEHDPILRDIVVLKPDWLATTISFVLDDKETRNNKGLIHLSRLSELWNDSARLEEMRYPEPLHQIFLRLMERFDLSYRVAEPYAENESDSLSLIAQLVGDTRPEDELTRKWSAQLVAGDIQQKQICCIVDNKSQSANAEGLFYQLIVRLHKYSLGRSDHRDSIHWQRGLLLDDDYNGRALLEHKGNDLHITVRAPYPERFLAMLTSEVKYLVESFWEGLRCHVMVPCVEPCGTNAPGTGLFNVEKLIASKRKKYPEYPLSGL